MEEVKTSVGDSRDSPGSEMVGEEALRRQAGRRVVVGETGSASVACVGLVVPVVAVAILSAGSLAVSRLWADPSMPALGGSPGRWVEVLRRPVVCRHGDGRSRVVHRVVCH